MGSPARVSGSREGRGAHGRPGRAIRHHSRNKELHFRPVPRVRDPQGPQGVVLTCEAPGQATAGTMEIPKNFQYRQMLADITARKPAWEKPKQTAIAKYASGLAIARWRNLTPADRALYERN